MSACSPEKIDFFNIFSIPSLRFYVPRFARQGSAMNAPARALDRLRLRDKTFCLHEGMG
jgi:hypothetical protein